MTRMHAATLTRIGVIAAAVLALELGCRAGIIPRLVLIAPSEMVLAMVRLLGDAAMLESLGFTLLVVVVSTLLSCLLGLMTGLVIHSVPRLREIVEPVLSAYYAVPNFIFYPLFIVIFGLGAASLVALSVLFATGAMVIATIDGLDSIRPIYRRAAQVLGVSYWTELSRVRLPAAAPYLLTGLKLVIVYSFIAVIAGEFLLSDRGMGHEIAYAYNNFDNRTMYGLIVLLILVMATINGLLSRISLPQSTEAEGAK